MMMSRIPVRVGETEDGLVAWDRGWLPFPASVTEGTPGHFWLLISGAESTGSIKAGSQAPVALGGGCRKQLNSAWFVWQVLMAQIPDLELCLCPGARTQLSRTVVFFLLREEEEQPGRGACGRTTTTKAFRLYPFPAPEGLPASGIEDHM